MRIAFDLDDLLIPTTQAFAIGSQSLPMPYGIFFKEEIRNGAKLLLKTLSASHDVLIYTTSLRSQFYVFLWFKLWGVTIKQVINHQIHTQRVLSTPYAKFSKAPGLFDIDVLIDDSLGVKQECDIQSCRTIIVKPDDLKWTERILSQIDI